MLTQLNGAISDSVATIVVDATLTLPGYVPESGLILIDDELIAVATIGGSGTHSYTSVLRGQHGTEAAAHLDNAPVYAVQSIQYKNTEGPRIYYYLTGITGGLAIVQVKNFITPQIPALDGADAGTVLAHQGDGLVMWIAPDIDFTTQALPTHLTDNTVGTPGAALPVVRVDSLANLGADVRNIAASLNAQINALQTALAAATVKVID